MLFFILYQMSSENAVYPLDFTEELFVYIDQEPYV